MILHTSDGGLVLFGMHPEGIVSELPRAEGEPPDPRVLYCANCLVVWQRKADMWPDCTAQDEGPLVDHHTPAPSELA